MINSTTTKFHDTIKSFIFSIIYPAPSIFSARTRNYQGAKDLADLILNEDKSRHLLYFDLKGNLSTSITASDIPNPNTFEVILIKNPRDKSFYNTKIQYIIYYGGNTTCAEILLPEMIECYNRHDKNICVVGFNPPGVGRSPGVATFDTNCAALDSIIKHLLLQHIPAENILIIGHSLGASFGAKIVAQHQKQGKNIRIFIDRSMSSISNAAKARILKYVPTVLLRYTLGYLLVIFSKLLIKLLHLEIDLVNDFVAINKINFGSARAMAAKEDEMMAQCCLLDELPADQMQHVKKFELHRTDHNRKSHSAHRHLLFSKQDGNKTAEEYLDDFIKEFPKRALQHQ